MGTHVQYSALSLNQYQNNGTDKQAIAKWHVDTGDKATRVDLALDVRNSELNIIKLYMSLRTKTAKTKLSTYNVIDGPNGTTLYLGARQSDLMLRIYDKAKEQNTDENWKRIELEAKHDRAEEIAKRIANGSHAENAALAKGVIKNMVQFSNKVWTEIMGDISIAIAKSDENATDTVAWLLGTVAPAMGKFIKKNGDNGLLEKFLIVVAGFSEPDDTRSEQG
jgi:hypothetical protein